TFSWSIGVHRKAILQYSIRLRTPAHGAAVHALIAGTAANHDGAAVRTGRRILLVQTRDTADAGHRGAPSWSLGRDRDHLLAGSGLFTGNFFRLLFTIPTSCCASRSRNLLASQRKM